MNQAEGSGTMILAEQISCHRIIKGDIGTKFEKILYKFTDKS